MALQLKDVWRNSVILTDERMAHILGHPEMRGQENRLSETLLEPEVVVQSQIDDGVRPFHRFYQGLSIGNKFLSVVVKYAQDNTFVITAYFTDRVKRGEVIWKK
jgi:hypothetical protein